MLTQVPDAEEIFITLRKMSLEKALGSNGMTVLFFEHFWEVVGMDVILTVCDFFEHGELLPHLNATNIALISKVENPSKVS